MTVNLQREERKSIQHKIQHIMARLGGGIGVKGDSREKRPNRNLRRVGVTSVVFCVWCTGCLPCTIFSSFKAPTYNNNDMREPFVELKPTVYYYIRPEWDLTHLPTICSMSQLPWANPEELTFIG